MNSKKSNRFSPEVRERAVRMVQEHRCEYPSLWACIESIAPKIGCVHWYNHIRLLEPIGYIPPAEAEANYWQQFAQKSETASST